MPTLAELWQQRQRQVTDATAAKVLAAWDRVRLTDPQRTFAAVLPELLAAVTAGQVAAATGAERYVAAVVATAGLRPAPVAIVSPRRLAGLTSDGRTLQGLLTQPLLRSLYLRARGADDVTALAGGRLSLGTLVRTEIADTSRDAVSIASALEPQIVGHVRVVPLPACSRCVVLAGRFYIRSTRFSRHPRCNCGMEPVTKRRNGSDPRELFDGMTSEQQDQAFGKTNAEVIRRGGDIGQVVNARRGMAIAGSNWTTEGTSKRGTYGRQSKAPRPSPGALLRFADTPDEFATALARAGYL